MIFWSHNDFLSRRSHYALYEFTTGIVICQNTTSAFHKVV